MLGSTIDMRRRPAGGVLRARALVAALLAAGALAAIGACSSWRTALAAGLAAAAIALMRTRYGAAVAVVLLAVVALLALTGRTAGSDERDAHRVVPAGAQRPAATRTHGGARTKLGPGGRRRDAR